MLITCMMSIWFLPQSKSQAATDSIRLRAFQVSPVAATSPEFMQCVENKYAKPFQHQLLKKYGIIVLTERPDQNLTPMSSLESCSRMNAQWSEVPTIENRSTYQVPTNEIIIRFKSSATALQIEKLRNAYGLKIIQSPTNRAPSRYIMSLQGASAAKSVSIAETLSKLREVEYAEPRFVVIGFPLQQ